MTGCLTKHSHQMAEFADRYPDFHFQINMKGVTSGYISLADAMIGVIRSVHPTMSLPDNMPAIKGNHGGSALSSVKYST